MINVQIAIQYIGKVMQDDDGTPSSKRWVALLSFLMITITWGANLFGNYVPTEFIFDALVYITLGCLGITGLEKFSGRLKLPNPTQDQADSTNNK